MADNLNVTPGAGAIIALDDVNGVLHQRVKLVLGSDGQSDGDVSKSNPIPTEIKDVSLALNRLLQIISNPLSMDPLTGRLRVMLDPIGGAQTLGTVTTVGTVTTCSTLTNMAQVGGVRADSVIYDAMHSAWAHAVRPRIS